MCGTNSSIREGKGSLETRQLKCVREHLKRRQTVLAGTQAHAGTHKLHTGTHRHTQAHGHTDLNTGHTEGPY